MHRERKCGQRTYIMETNVLFNYTDFDTKILTSRESCCTARAWRRATDSATEWHWPLATARLAVLRNSSAMATRNQMIFREQW